MTKHEIIEKLENLSTYEIVKVAFDAMVPGLKSGYAAFDPETGELQGVSLGVGESIQNENRIYLYRVEQNVFGNSPYYIEGDILSEEEYEDYEKKLENGEIDDVEEYLSKYTNDSFDRRFLNYLVFCAEDEIDLDDIVAELKETL